MPSSFNSFSAFIKTERCTPKKCVQIFFVCIITLTSIDLRCEKQSTQNAKRSFYISGRKCEKCFDTFRERPRYDVQQVYGDNRFILHDADKCLLIDLHDPCFFYSIEIGWIICIPAE